MPDGVIRVAGEAGPQAMRWTCDGGGPACGSPASSQNENFQVGFGKNRFARYRPDAGFCCTDSPRME